METGQQRRFFEVLALAGAIVASMAGFVWTAKGHIEATYQRKTDALEAHIQLQIDAIERHALHHALPKNEVEQLEQLRQIRSKIQGLE